MALLLRREGGPRTAWPVLAAVAEEARLAVTDPHHRCGKRPRPLPAWRVPFRAEREPP